MVIILQTMVAWRSQCLVHLPRIIITHYKLSLFGDHMVSRCDMLASMPFKEVSVLCMSSSSFTVMATDFMKHCGKNY